MAWTASLPSVVTGNPTKASDYNNLLNNVLFRRDTATGDVTQHIIAVGSDGSAAAPAIKRNADATGLYFAAGAVNVSCAGTQVVSVAANILTVIGAAAQANVQALINGAIAASGTEYVGFYAASGAGLTSNCSGFWVGALSSTTNAYGLNIANQSVVGVLSGVNIGTLTCSGASSSATGVGIGNISGVAASYGVKVGTVATSAGGANSYGMYLAGGSATGGGGALPYSLYSAGSGVVMHNGGAIRIGGGDASAYALASTTMFTSVTVAPTLTNTQTIKTAAAAGSQAGWIKIYVGTTAQYVPYWSAT